MRKEDVPLQPCHRSWESLEAGVAVRRCEECARSVTDLSALREVEARRVLATARGRACVRYRHRADGRIIFREPARQGVGAAVIGAALLAACSNEPEPPVRAEAPLAVIGDAPPRLDLHHDSPAPDPKIRGSTDRSTPLAPAPQELSAEEEAELDCKLLGQLSQLGYYVGPEPICD